MDLNSGTRCPDCDGTGLIIFEKTMDDMDGRTYEFARKCPKCAGLIRDLDDTGIPLQFFEADMSKFNFGAYGRDMSKFRKTVMNFFDNYPEWEKVGMGLYFSSETPGSGKTLLSCCIARSVMFRYDIQMRFVTATDYLSAVGESYKLKAGDIDPSKVYRECNLLVLDDLGAQKEGSWQDQEIFRLIDTRVIKGNVTIITSNMSQKDLNLNDRTIDRIISTTMPLPFPEFSVRRKQSQDKQSRIIKSILEEVT